MRNHAILALVGVVVVGLSLPLLTAREQPGQKKQVDLPPQEQANQNLVRLSAPGVGIVQAVPVKIGQQVKKGDVLLRLDDHLARLDVERAKRKIEKAQAEHKATEAKLKEAEVQFHRILRLQRQADIAPEDITIKKLTVELQVHHVAACTAAIKIAEVDFKEATILLDKHTIRAPADGVVQRILYRPGEMVRALEPVVVIEIKNTPKKDK